MNFKLQLGPRTPSIRQPSVGSIEARTLQRLRSSVAGQPHSRNLDRWGSLVQRGDVLGLHRVLTGLDRGSIEMREVLPMGGLLPQSERATALQEAS